MGSPAVERWGAVRARADGQPGLHAHDEGIRVAPAAVHLRHDIEAFPSHAFDEAPDSLLVDRLVHGRPDAGNGRQDHDPVDRPRPPFQEIRVPGLAEEYQFGIRIGMLQRVQGRQGEDEVAHRVRPQDGDLRYPVEPGRFVAHGRSWAGAREADDAARSPCGSSAQGASTLRSFSVVGSSM